MLTPGPDAGGFDVALALRRIGLGFWLDFAPIVLLGFGLITLPGLASALVPGTSGVGTGLAVVSGLGATLFLTMVSYGVVARLQGRPLDPGGFLRLGLVASPPGFNVALLIGAGLVVLAIVSLLGSLAWAGVRPLMIGVAMIALTALLPAVPAALAERLGPLPALRRSARLTQPHRGRIAMIGLVLILTIGPARLVLVELIRGIEAGVPVTLASPGLWLRALFDLIAASILAVVPGVVYVGLTEPH